MSQISQIKRSIMQPSMFVYRRKMALLLHMKKLRVTVSQIRNH